MSGEQRDEEAAFHDRLEWRFYFKKKKRKDLRNAYKSGWDSLASTLPGRETIKIQLWSQLEETLTEGQLFDLNNPNDRMRFDELMGKTSEAVLALFNGEVEHGKSRNLHRKEAKEIRTEYAANAEGGTNE